MTCPGFGLAAGLGLASATCLAAGYAFPQSVNSTPDLTALIAQARAAADAASAANTALANVPQPCNTVPSADTLAGSIGSGNCYTRNSDTRPTSVQATVVTTDSTGAWSVTWAKAFSTPDPYINPQPVNPSALQPMTCNVTSSSTTQVSGRCWMQNVMTTPLVSASLLNLQLVGTAASIQVRVVGRDRTQ